MRFQSIFTSVAAAAALSACSGIETARLDTTEQRGSYAVGVSISRDIARSGARFDNTALVAGLRDGLAGGELPMTQEELAQAFQEFTTAAREQAGELAAQLGERNRVQGAEFLAENGARAEVTTLPSGLQYEVVTPGDGARPTATNRVSINYRGTLVDGTEFDAGEGAVFRVNGVIPGFSEGIQQMAVGSTYRLYIPGDIGYGMGGSAPNIGPNATLIFEVELLAIVE